MVVRAQKWPEIIGINKNGRKWSKMVRNGRKWPNTVINGQKWVFIEDSGVTWFEVVWGS